jgi:zinc D-Ala-D-Ala dipeptidase
VSPHVLVDPRELTITVPRVGRAIQTTRIPEQVVPVEESNQPLVVITGLSTLPMYHDQGLPFSVDVMHVRAEVHERLCRASTSLPTGFEMIVLDGWRSRSLQRYIYERAYASRPFDPGYVSDPESRELIPPHLTGGAVDVTLAWHGTPLKLGTDFDAFSPESWADAFEMRPAGDVTRELRRLLTGALADQGFVPYPMEWWHFSFGDQIWAANARVTAAIYGEASP